MPDNDVIEGMIKHAEGHVQSVIGDLTDNPKLQAKGTVNRIAGKAQERVGHLKDAAKAATHGGKS